VSIKTKTAFNRVLQFKEKPDKKTASRFLKAKRFLWNAGMFIWRADTLEKAFTTHAEDIGKIIQPLAQARNLKLTLKKLYPELRSISFDYAVMEKASNVLVARSSFQWSDVGSWQALAQHLPSDENGNTIIGDVTIDDTCSTTALSSPGHRIALAGLKDVIVIHSAKATLVISKKAAGNMKRIAEKALR
jgi:mannose-1-phosphate guanylyltransferase